MPGEVAHARPFGLPVDWTVLVATKEVTVSYGWIKRARVWRLRGLNFFPHGCWNLSSRR